MVQEEWKRQTFAKARVLQVVSILPELRVIARQGETLANRKGTNESSSAINDAPENIAGQASQRHNAEFTGAIPATIAGLPPTETWIMSRTTDARPIAESLLFLSF